LIGEECTNETLPIPDEVRIQRIKRCQLFLDHVSQLMVTIFLLDEISHMGLIDQSVLPAAKLHEK
jgi:hypothetical protein